jgi:hypothetical protein
MKELNPCVWFGKRELTSIPKHFIKANTPKTDDSYYWVLINLKGRFGTLILTPDHINPMLNRAQIIYSDFSSEEYFFFEDPAEAMFYELRWSGK